MRKKALAITSAYMIIGLLWIVITDSVHFTLNLGNSNFEFISILKGCIYVFLTSGLIFILVNRALRDISEKQTLLEKANQALIDEREKMQQSEKRLKYISEHDFYTGLANRRYFNDFMQKEFLSLDPGKKHAVILAYFSKLTFFNMTRGSLYSEQLVKNLSIILYSLSSENITLFQLSADRFLFYIKGYDDRPELTELCALIIEKCNRRLIRCGVQLGVVEIDGDTEDPDCLVKYASIAAASNEYDSCYAFFSNEMVELLLRRDTIISELTLEAGKAHADRLYVEYQPIVAAGSRRIVGFEALARFSSAAYGPVPPSEFIAIAEEENLIIELGWKIINAAFDFAGAIKEAGHQDICVTINLSAIQLLSDVFITELEALTRTKDIDAQNIVIELTESLLANNYEDMNLKIWSLNSLGMKVAIDDFGTGYSSLARERELRVNCLKIDKYFIDDLSTSDNDREITADIISMAHKLGHCVVAEGVEDVFQELYLHNHGCDYMQGYLFSRPVAGGKAFELLEDQPGPEAEENGRVPLFQMEV